MPVDLQPVYFDADVELESVVQGQVGGRVPAKKILGFVQLAPRGIPLTPAAFQALLVRQFGSIGGPLDCIMDIGKSGQKFRVNCIDVNASVDAAGTTPVFVAAARGNVVLPKDGSWSLVTHARGTRRCDAAAGKRVGAADSRRRTRPTNMTYPDTALLRIANPGRPAARARRRDHQLRLPAEHQHAEGAVPDAGVRQAGDRYGARQAAEQDAAAVRRRLSADGLEGRLPQHRRRRDALRHRDRADQEFRRRARCRTAARTCSS